MNRKILVTVLAVAMLMILPAVAPVMASQPKTTYTFGEVTFADPEHPNEEFYSADNLLHARGGGSFNYLFGAPWGDSITPGYVTNNLFTIDFSHVPALSGQGCGHFIDSYPTGTLEGSTTYEFTEIGVRLYAGPEITVGDFHVEAGDPLLGTVFEGRAVANGEIGGEGIHWSTDYVAVGLLDPSTFLPLGINVVWGQATYMVTG